MAIMRCQSQVCTLFREALLAEGFTEIHTPKLGSESEGGAGVFRTDYPNPHPNPHPNSHPDH